MDHDRSASALRNLDGRNFATVPEAALVLECDQRTVRDMLGRGEIPGTRTGRHWRIPAAWLRQQAGVQS